MITVETAGSHGTPSVPKGTALFSMKQKEHLGVLAQQQRRLSTLSVKKHLATIGQPCDVSSRQLAQFVSRENRKAHGLTRVKHRVGELKAIVEAWRSKQPDWRTAAPTELCLIGQSRADGNKVFVPFSCQGMLRTIHSLPKEYCALVVDGKQKLFTGAFKTYTVLTLSFISKKQAQVPTRMRGQHGQSIQSTGQTSCQRPFMQALVNSEHTENVASLFELACVVALELAGIRLADWVLQINKDYGLGIELGRQQVFPLSRPLNDYPHLSRAARTQLYRLGAGRDMVEQVLRLLSLTRSLPHIWLFDAIWRCEFHRLNLTPRGQRVAKYLMRTFFKKLKGRNNFTSTRREIPAWASQDLLWADHWCGVLGTMPGTATGSQSLEGFHSGWQQMINAQGRASLTQTLDVMQGLYHEQWRAQLQLEDPPRICLLPVAPDPTLLNGSQLHTAGRSTAVEYWDNRDKPNYRLIAQENSRFHVMVARHADSGHAATLAPGPTNSQNKSREIHQTSKKTKQHSQTSQT